MGKLKKILQANMCCGGQRSLRKGPSLSSLLVDEHLSKGDYLIMKMVRIKSNDKHLGVFQHRKLHTQLQLQMQPITMACQEKYQCQFLSLIILSVRTDRLSDPAYLSRHWRHYGGMLVFALLAWLPQVLFPFVFAVKVSQCLSLSCSPGFHRLFDLFFSQCLILLNSDLFPPHLEQLGDTLSPFRSVTPQALFIFR